MEAKDFTKVIMFMANQWSKEVAHQIYGKVMGDHFYNKWTGAGTSDLGTMRLFYSMSEEYLQQLIDAALKHYSE